MSDKSSPGYQISDAVEECDFPKFQELCNKFPEVATDFARQGSDDSRGYWSVSNYASPPLLLVARASKENPKKGREAGRIFEILLVLEANAGYVDYYGNTLEKWFMNPDNQKCVPLDLKEKIDEFLAADDKETYISDLRARLDFKL